MLRDICNQQSSPIVLDDQLHKMLRMKIWGRLLGLLVVAATETTTTDDMDALARAIGEVL